MLSLKKTLILMVATAGLAVGSAGAASASDWTATHAGRAEVNHRLANQNDRIRDERKAGEISAAKAARLHAADRSIHRQERRMARRDDRHGHLTAQQLHRLNREENGVSRHIPH